MAPTESSAEEVFGIDEDSASFYSEGSDVPLRDVLKGPLSPSPRAQTSRPPRGRSLTWGGAGDARQARQQKRRRSFRRERSLSPSLSPSRTRDLNRQNTASEDDSHLRTTRVVYRPSPTNQDAPREAPTTPIRRISSRIGRLGFPSTPLSFGKSSSAFGSEGVTESPVSLEGTLMFRKSRTSDNLKSWRQAYVVFDMRDGGSISCYKHQKPDRKERKKQQHHPSSRISEAVSDVKDMSPRVHLGAHINWIVKDIQNNSWGFVVEVPIDSPLLPHVPQPDTTSKPQPPQLEYSVGDDLTGIVAPPPFLESNPSLGGESNPSLGTTWNSLLGDLDDISVPDDLQNDLDHAKKRSGQPFRLYFRCSKGGNEKFLWLKAFEQVNRLSRELHLHRPLRNAIQSPKLRLNHSRIRSTAAKMFALERKALEDSSVDALPCFDNLAKLNQRYERGEGDNKEYLVKPLYAYPNRWMTFSELYLEMMKPSETFFDTRIPHATQKEIGQVKVEVLQCLGLPALDFGAKSDAVVYVVCGSYAFTTDIIPNNLNPLWLPRARRACSIPLFHAYARLYVGVIDDDGKGSDKDDFVGRVVLDLARCRPGTTYDVTLPLRLSGHVYSRRSRGSIRLRFSISYKSGRDAILSYIPKGILVPTSRRPNNDVTVICADAKAFRNVVYTVHGTHPPGRFSFNKLKAALREINFTRKIVINTIRGSLFDIVKYKYPLFSFAVFGAWMHGVYKNDFSLVPFYLVLLLLSMMLRTYAFFGSDGPVQNGFTPPSWTELFLSLVRGGSANRIKPLEIKQAPTRSSRRAESFILHTDKSIRRFVAPNTRTIVPKFEKPQFARFLRLFGISKELRKNTDPQDYHMEFPFSQGLQDPETKKASYPKLTVKESLVLKSNSKTSKNKKKSTKGSQDEGTEDENEDLDGDESIAASEITRTADASPRRRIARSDIFGRQRRKARNKTTAPRKAGSAPAAFTIEEDTPVPSTSKHDVPYEMLPSRFRIPKQNVEEQASSSAAEGKKRSFLEELAQTKDNIHRITFHAFNDRTHLVRRKDAGYFGQEKGRKFQLDVELDKLLGTGQYCSANPVMRRVGVYMDPMILAVQSGLSLSRAIYNLVTWRDPILSFLVTLVLILAALVLAYFPWRLFFFVTGLALVGPQNYVLRVMHLSGTTPRFIKEFWEQRKKAREERRRLRQTHSEVIPQDQPVFSSLPAASDFKKSMEDAKPDEVHEASIPYSQLMYNRMYDWPPEPQYATCLPIAERTTTAPNGGRGRKLKKQDSSMSLNAKTWHVRTS